MGIKLSKQQVDALSTKIKEDLVTLIVTPIKEANDKIRESEEYTNFETTNADCVLLNTLEAKYGFSKYDVNRQRNQIKETFFKDRFQKIPSINSDKIVNEIYLATIDAADLESLIKAVSSKLM